MSFLRRPEADRSLSRGNLAGDKYSLIWDPILIPPEQVESSTYSPVEPSTVTKVTAQHIHDVRVRRPTNRG